MHRNRITLKIYIEGGGEGKGLHTRFQEAWTKFFQSAGLIGRKPRIVPGKGRDKTFDLFLSAIQNRSADEMPLLLLDSEDEIDSGKTVWQHLKDRDGFKKPRNATDEHAYLMAQVMETWFLADLETLGTFFGSKFKAYKIPGWKNLESIPKQIIFDVLDEATVDCLEKKYAKGKVSYEILGKINPHKVKERCPNAKRLLDFLAKKR